MFQAKVRSFNVYTYYTDVKVRLVGPFIMIVIVIIIVIAYYIAVVWSVVGNNGFFE